MLLGDDPMLHSLTRLLIERTDGNPLFLEESVRHLVELNVLAGEWGRRRLVKAPTTIQVPPTVGAILAARIDRLPPDEKRLLQSAAVIGKDVPFSLLKIIADQPEEQLRRSLSHLQAAEFLYEANLFPELEYTFKHALTHEVAYGSLLQQTRRTLHGRIMAAIEQLHPERLAEHVESLANHAFRGGVWASAIQYLRQASTKAVTRSAHSEAVRCLEQALVALKGLPETRDTLEQAIDIRLGLRTSLFALGDIRRGLDYVHEAEGLARKIDDPRRLGLALAFMGVNTWSTGHPLEARNFTQNALAIATKLDDHPLMVLANFYLGSGNLVLGDYRSAEGFLKRTMELLEGRQGERTMMAGFPAVMARGWLAWVLANRRPVRSRPHARARSASHGRSVRPTVQPSAYLQRPRIPLLHKRRSGSSVPRARTLTRPLARMEPRHLVTHDHGAPGIRLRAIRAGRRGPVLAAGGRDGRGIPRPDVVPRAPRCPSGRDTSPRSPGRRGTPLRRAGPHVGAGAAPARL